MSREAMKLALEALETERPYLGPMPTKTSKAITTLREALVEQPKRPYRQLQDNGSKYFGESWDKAEQPAQRKPLTLQELEAAWNAQADRFNQWDELGLDEIVAWAQADHNIKENT